jgi:hypothetical protein
VKRSWILVLGIGLALLACPKSATRKGREAPLELELEGSLRLPSTAAAVCADAEGLLLPDNSGTNIYRVGFDLGEHPPLALPTRLPGIRTLAADEFFIYLFDNTRLLRLDRSSGQLTPMCSNVAGQSAAILNSGQLAFSDGFSRRILLVGPEGGMTDYNTQLPIEPTAIAGQDGNLYVLDPSRQVVVVLNRVGNLVRQVPTPLAAMRIAVDDSLNLYLLDRSGTRIEQVSARGQSRIFSGHERGIEFVASDLVVRDAWLYLLDSGRRILRFRLPWGSDHR